MGNPGIVSIGLEIHDFCISDQHAGIKRLKIYFSTNLSNKLKLESNASKFYLQLPFISSVGIKYFKFNAAKF